MGSVHEVGFFGIEIDEISDILPMPAEFTAATQ